MKALMLRTVLLACLLQSPWVLAQVTIYRQVDDTGRIIFSDIPQPNAREQNKIESVNPAQPEGPVLPMALRAAADRYPVTLYTSADCQVCDAGRQLLQQRGIPVIEKTISSPQDAEALNQLSGAVSVPLLTIGQQKLKGFSEAQWQQYLSAAGYPASSALPPGYRNPAPEPLVRLQTVAQPQAAPPAPTPSEPAPAPQAAPVAGPQNPTGIIF